MNHTEIVAQVGRLVEQYQSPLRRYLWYLTHGDATLADDLAQETFIKAFERYETYRGGSVKSWLFTIAFRTYLDNKRSAKTFESIDICAKHWQTDAGGEILNVALDCLDENEKNLLLLSVVEQFSHSEISKLLAIPLGSVKGTIKRAKTKLKEHLSNEEL